MSTPSAAKHTASRKAFEAVRTGTARFQWKRPKLYEKQEVAIFAPQRIAVIEASTKTGKTAGCIVWLVEQAIRGKRGQHYWWVAPTRNVAKIAYKRVRRIFPPHSVLENRNDLTIELPNGAILAFLGADNPDSLYGEDVYAAVFDEATRAKEGAWYAVRSTLTATQGAIRIIGNVKGRKNWAYKLARLAENGEPGMHYARLTVWDAVEAGLIPKEEVAAAERDLPPDVFKELYLAQPSEDGGNPFGLTNINAAVERWRQRVGDTHMPADGTLRDHRGHMLPVTAWGWDVAKAMTWTVGCGLDDQATLVRFARWHGRPWSATMEDIAALTGQTPALIDSTGVGSPVVEALQRVHPTMQGFIFTEQSKQHLMEQLAIELSRGTLAIPEGPLANELREFEYTYSRRGVRYAAPDGGNDDTVMALGLALEARRLGFRGITGRSLLLTL